MPTLDEIIAQSAAQNTLSNSAIDLTIAAYDNLGRQQAAIASSTQELGDASSVIATQQEAGALQAQEATRTAARAFGTDVADPTQIVTSLAAELNARFNAARASAAKIDAAEAAGKSSPLQGIKNILTLPQEYENYNANVDQYNLIASHLEQVNQLTQMQAKTQADIAPTRTAATVQAVATQAKAKTDIAVAQANQQALLYNVQGTKEVVNMSQQELQNSVSTFQLQEAQKSRELQRQSLDLQIQDRLDKVKLQKESEQEQEEIAQDVRVGRAMLFGDKTAPLPTKLIIRNLQGQNPNPEFVSYMRAGQRLRITGEAIISEDPGKAAAFVINTGAPLTPEMKEVKNLLLQSASAAAAGQTTIGVVAPKDFDRSKVDQVVTLTSQNATAAAKIQQNRITANDFSNIYQAPSAASIATLKGLQTDPFFNKVLKTQIENGMTESDPSRILALAAESVQNGTVKINEAAQGMALFFTGAAKLNNEIKQYKRVGLPEQTSYNAFIQVDPLVSKTVDMTSRAELAKILSQRLAMKGIPASMLAAPAPRN